MSTRVSSAAPAAVRGDPVPAVATPAPIEVPPEVCTLYPRASRLEWLLTNGTGGFAMGTVAGSNTRRYHGLLVASLHPPVARVVTLARLEETVLTPQGPVPLSVNQYPNTLHPEGHTRLVRFSLEEGPVWTWSVGGVEVERRVLLAPGSRRCWRATRAPRRCGCGSSRCSPSATTTRSPVVTPTPGPASRSARWGMAGRCASSHTRVSRRSGSFIGVAPSPAHRPGTRTSSTSRSWTGGSTSVKTSCSPAASSWSSPPEGRSSWRRRSRPEASLDLDAVGSLFARASPTPRPPAPRPARAIVDLDDARARLERAADAYPVRRADGSATVIAGYPWFTDWGRDTMIALPGLLVTRGRLDLAREVLEGFLAHLDGGLVPNRFPDAAGPAEYNTVDATLFMFQAVHAWERAGGPAAFVRDVFYPAACAIVDAHLRGTHHGIHVDPRDGLLVAGGPGSNLTWMDARVDGVPVTPRHGKPVEVNALWYNALRLSERWARGLGDGPRARSFGREADLVAGSFDRAFWNDARRCCFDVVLPEGPDARLRPNQLLAVGLPFPLLDGRRRAMVLEAVEAALLTPVGLRTLARWDPGYRASYRGSPAERDSAYHQGLVWPWLLGPYVDALFAVRGDSAETRSRARAAIASLVGRMDTGCLGQLPECFEPEPPFRPVGAPAQAWSVAEALRVLVRIGGL